MLLLHFFEVTITFMYINAQNFKMLVAKILQKVYTDD